MADNKEDDEELVQVTLTYRKGIIGPIEVDRRKISPETPLEMSLDDAMRLAGSIAVKHGPEKIKEH